MGRKIISVIIGSICGGGIGVIFFCFFIYLPYLGIVLTACSAILGGFWGARQYNISENLLWIFNLLTPTAFISFCVGIFFNNATFANDYRIPLRIATVAFLLTVVLLVLSWKRQLLVSRVFSTVIILVSILQMVDVLGRMF